MTKKHVNFFACGGLISDVEQQGGLREFPLMIPWALEICNVHVLCSADPEISHDATGAARIFLGQLLPRPEVPILFQNDFAVTRD